jgi:hypothetical protein
MLNLDRLAAEHAQNIIMATREQNASDVDNTITRALGVLQEHGVYACFLFLLAKEKSNGRTVVQQMLKLLDELGFGWGQPVDQKPETILKHISEKVSVDLERLLLAKETLEQMLIYARYGAKARE